jgi:hypothetical protein
VPTLLTLALAEWWSGITGTVDRFEADIRRHVARVVDDFRIPVSDGVDSAGTGAMDVGGDPLPNLG